MVSSLQSNEALRSILLLFIIVAILGNSSLPLCANSSHHDMSLEKQFKEGYSHGWAIRHKSLKEVYQKFDCKICIEIGVARGELTQMLMHEVPSIQQYYGIDPFLGNYDKSDAMSEALSQFNSNGSDHQSSSARWMNAVLYNLRQHGCKYQHYHALSSDAFKAFRNESVDCVFIDGDHTYEGAKKDITLYGPILKPGGLFIFDDYSRQYMGVVKAVDELVDSNNLTFVKINKHNNYYVQKPINKQLIY